MSKLVQALQTGDAFTANGAVTNSSTDSALLDFFAIAAAMRKRSEQDILNMWIKAYAENEELALRTLLWLRDCRGGAGERRTFRIIYKFLKERNQDAAVRVMQKIPFLGRWDDIFESGDVKNYELEFVWGHLNDGLLCKWIPRKGIIFKQLCELGKMSYGSFRRLIVGNSKTVEQLMSAKNWEGIKYQSVPSRAMSIYSNAFKKHSPAAFAAFMQKVEKGEAKINAGTLYPYDLLRNIRTGKGRDVIDAQWKALPNYTTDENMLVMADVSESMLSGNGTVAPIDVSVSLAIYVSERNTGIFKDTFITFTERPTLQVLKGSFTDRVRQVQGPVGYSTNFIAAFDLILQKAKEFGLSQDDLPTKVIAISDMEFNSCGSQTNFNAIKARFEAAGYKMPTMVFWNVNGRPGNNPIKSTDENTCLVSGCSPSILMSVLGERVTPYDVMLKTIMNERYAL